MPKIGEQIRARRIEIGMSQQELAERTGYTDRSSITKIEKGVNDIAAGKIDEFAIALKINPDDLMNMEVENSAAAAMPKVSKQGKYPKKLIYLNPALKELDENTKTGKFSMRLGTIVEQYNLINELTTTPELSKTEKLILKELLRKQDFNAAMIEYMPQLVLMCSFGSEEERKNLFKILSEIEMVARVKLAGEVKETL